MTAIVGVMNKHAVALAADSAVTITSYNGRKVLNTANKIFNISKYEPVGLMVYSNASFMGTPWDLIVKLYRKKLNDKKFDFLSEYVNDFIKFVKDNTFFCTENQQKEILFNKMQGYYAEVYSSAKQNCEKRTPGIPIPDFEILQEMIGIFNTITAENSKFVTCEDFNKYDIESFKRFSEYAINDLKKTIKNIPDGFIDSFIASFFNLISKQRNMPGYTGLVFVGYGEKEIYPGLIPVNMLMAFDGKLRYHIDKKEESYITETNRASISPFAQVDVMMNILTGIATPIKELVYQTFSRILGKYNSLIENLLIANGVDNNIVEIIKKAPLPAVTNEFVNSIEQYIQEEYIRKLIDTVEYLDIEDLSNMAESLIALTGLKKRMTSSEENVGGPVDVAVISKIDGFIWMKRKHYFDKDLNSQFFERYNR